MLQFFVVILSFVSVYAQDYLMGADILEMENYKIKNANFPKRLARKVYKHLHDPGSFFEAVKYYKTPFNKRDAIHAREWFALAHLTKTLPLQIIVEQTALAKSLKKRLHQETNMRTKYNLAFALASVYKRLQKKHHKNVF